MTIEILYKDVCNLYGDIANIKYLEQTLTGYTFVYTSITDEPAFLNDDISLIYIGSMTENVQLLVLQQLIKYKNKIKELIEKNVVFIVTGNALELFGNIILSDDKEIKALGIFDYYTKHDMEHRYNSLFLGEFNNIEVVGFKNQFGRIYAENHNNYFINVKRGMGINESSMLEGIKYKNFYGTSLLGPFLVLNPLITRYILKDFKFKKLAFEEDAIIAYKQRLKEFKDDNLKYTSH